MSEKPETWNALDAELDDTLEEERRRRGILTRDEMTERYGSLPFGITVGSEYKWTICRAHADVTWITVDGGDTWRKKGIIYAGERQRRDDANLEQQRIQRELK